MAADLDPPLSEVERILRDEEAHGELLGADLLDGMEVFLARFVAFPSEPARIAVTLWAAHAHAVESFDSSPRLALLSPEPASGKTRALEILDLLVPKPMHVLNASVAVTFRAVDKNQPTLLLDEVDAIFGKRSKDEHEELRGLLNAGHRRGAQVPRCVGPNHELKLFNVYAACALAGLGDLPETLMTRSVVVRMRRRAPGEHVDPYRQRLHEHEGHELRDQLAEWIGQVAGDLGNAWPTMPRGVEDRPADVWEPLLAIADAAGGAWPTRARAACAELVKVAASGEASLGVRLLGDLRTIFGDVDALHTETILDDRTSLMRRRGPTSGESRSTRVDWPGSSPATRSRRRRSRSTAGRSRATVARRCGMHGAAICLIPSRALRPLPPAPLPR